MTAPLADRLPRLEDGPLVTGAGIFLADVEPPPGTLHAAFLRSPHAHARILSVDATAALCLPGVVAVLTGGDLLADDIGGVPWEVRPPGIPAEIPTGDARVAVPQPALAQGVVRFVGEAVALVLGETPNAARDGVEAVDVAFEALQPVAATADAAAPGAPQLWPEHAGNLAFRGELGNATATAACFAKAAHVVALRLENPRIAGVPIEPRGALATPLAGGRFDLLTPAGKPHGLRDTLCDAVFHWPRERLRVRTGQIGGGFGVKNVLYPEQVAVLWAASRLGRPVRWVSDRSEAFLSDVQGRDQVNDAALALDAEGRALALRVRTLAGLGACLAPRGIVPPMAAFKVLTGPYRIPQVHAVVEGVYSNAVPTCSFRGAGQPEAAYVLERLLDVAAERLGLSPAEIRARNLIAPDDLPLRTPGGVTLDHMDLPAMLRLALERADHAGFAARRRDAEARGHRLGFGIAACVEACGFGYDEQAELRVGADGALTLLIGTQSSGQGHASSYARLIAAELGIPATSVRVVQGDTDAIASGNGTGACRSLTVGGSAVQMASVAVAERARQIAADLLEASPDDVVREGDAWVVVGTDRRIAFAAIAAAAFDGSRSALDAAMRFSPSNFTFPAGVHAAEVGVDAETGALRLTRYTIVHDVGRAVSPAIVAGQLQGGVALGIGQALGEAFAYDGDGQAITASLMDYRALRADDLPPLPVTLAGDPTALNPIGAKSVGEAGPVVAPPAVVRAAVDALRAFGVRHIDMPLTPQRVWQAIRAARGT